MITSEPHVSTGGVQGSVPSFRGRMRQTASTGEQTSDALAALRTLQLNAGWDPYWQERRLLRMAVA